MFSTRGRRILAAGALTTGCAAATVLYYDEGSRRSLKFWTNVGPMYAMYRAVQFLNSDIGIISDDYANELYDKLHHRFTDKVKKLTYEMKGFYLKHAQLMSVQDDFVPPQYLKWLKDTQSDVPSQFTEKEAKLYVARLCKDELGIPFDDLFSSWDDKPLGVASIGQVHKAVLKSNGRPVAVKFLCPGIEQKFRADIKTLKGFCELAMPQHVSSFREIEKQFMTEFDYRNEAKALNTARNTTLPTWSSKVNIPEAYTDLCSENLLVMEYLDGIKLVDGIKQQFSTLASLTGKSLDEMEQERNQAIENGTFVYHTLDQEKSSFLQTKWYLFLNDIWQHNLRAVVHNYGPTRLIWPAKEYKWTNLSIDLGETIRLLCDIQADNIFNHGCFNGDQHPGNLMLLTDGRLGLIDYGQFKQMTLEHRIVFAKLIIALDRDDKDEIVRIYFDEMNTKTKLRDPEIAYRLACFWADRDTEDIMGEYNIATFIDFCQEKDPMISVAEDYIMACRASIMLRGIGKAFGLSLRISKLWRSAAAKFLKSQNIDY